LEVKIDFNETNDGRTPNVCCTIGTNEQLNGVGGQDQQVRQGNHVAYHQSLNDHYHHTPPTASLRMPATLHVPQL
jgi:hypothetical protein